MQSLPLLYFLRLCMDTLTENKHCQHVPLCVSSIETHGKWTVGLTSCPKMRVHISAPVSSPRAMTATPRVATACTDDSSLLASFSLSFSLLLLSLDLPETISVRNKSREDTESSKKRIRYRRGVM